jgi:hypothetical protein
MSAHTPGPWFMTEGWVMAEADKKPIANFNFYAATEANARLIAAAPELLEALRALLAERSHAAQLSDACFAARAAIARATGEQA